jgi:hypothetical protein
LIIAAAVVIGRRRQSIRPSTGWALAGLTTLAGCTVLAGAFDGLSSRTAAPIALLAGLAAVVMVVGASPGRLRCQFADIGTVLGGFLAVTAWIGVAFHLSPFGHPDGGLWRAATTVTYANAAAAVLAPICLWSIARRTSSNGPSRRALSVLIATGLIATFSRAGIASFVVGLAVLAGLLGFSAVGRVAAPTLLGASIAALGLIPGIGASSPARPLWAVAGLVGGVSVGMARYPRALVGRRKKRSSGRRMRVGLLGVVLAAAAATTIAVAGHSSLWSNRMSVASPDRSSLASVALHMWRTHFFTGVGPDHETFVWMTSTNRELFDRYAHDEYLQLAVEEGALGLLGLGAAAAGVAVTARRGWRSGNRGNYEIRALRAGAIAGLVSFALHSGFDFLWHVPVVPLIAAVAVGLSAVLPPGDEMSQPTKQKEVPCSVEDG